MNVFLLMLVKVYIQHIKFNLCKLQQISKNTYDKTQQISTNYLYFSG